MALKQDVLVIGSGAREHALVWGLKNSPQVGTIYAAPGNAGIAAVATCVPVHTKEEIIDFVTAHPMLVVIGPEAPLADGLADALRARGILVMGPGRLGAQLESSKAFAKDVMTTLDIPTARAVTAFSYEDLLQLIGQETRWPHVMKQSRLAAGKGVAVVHSAAQAQELASYWKSDDDLFVQGVLWEDYLEGREVSIQVLTNGKEYVWLPSAQDHKRLTADPDSPNTGGMGAYAPVPGISAADQEQINREVFDPLMQYFQDEKVDYRGVLYAGLMMTSQGPFVLEFNVRLGDPEAESVIPLLDVDWFSVWEGVAR
ncbi:MAG: phosphoribosylamine--glycine ligase, partial [Firmicutes bacterium]|nr:phosphoribosylamine--glycine ligase [Bacillota bacterium]